MRFIVFLFSIIFNISNAFSAEYCKHDYIRRFEEEGDTQNLTWNMTLISARNEGNKSNCMIDIVFSGGFDKPIEITKKPKFLKASIEEWRKVIIVPDKVGTDYMSIKITYIKKESGRVVTGYINYKIVVSDKELN